MQIGERGDDQRKGGRILRMGLAGRDKNSRGFRGGGRGDCPEEVVERKSLDSREEARLPTEERDGDSIGSEAEDYTDGRIRKHITERKTLIICPGFQISSGGKGGGRISSMAKGKRRTTNRRRGRKSVKPGGKRFKRGNPSLRRQG